ncbi:alpha/beta-hydrolase [Zopfia rhizophila CBS 207.26]|uniref:Alpha/beta-hydrolase n=1 Tax=Zopfia rhizophila CBS 207.26 TaxID=1314779 RepID=A0A6A6DY88_9PEZI|nr:alpha/beta-hydrolase [Zopfia rhizophila CBS 207.26]
MSTFMKVSTALACFFSVGQSLVQGDANSLLVVDLSYELHRASTFDTKLGIYNFSNIRYAVPPLGDLLFRPPQPPASNYSSINDGLDSRICPQANVGGLITSAQWDFSYITNRTLPNISYSPSPSVGSVPIPRDPRENEGCLFLDVFVPQSVLNSARTVGTFGFLSGPQFSKSGTPNAGLWDQRLALQWVQDKTHLFGGDKMQITVARGSAGAGSIIHQLTAFGGASKVASSPAQEDQAFNAFLQLANVSSLGEARAVSSDKLIYANAAQVAGSGYGFFTSGPSRDGTFVPQHPRLLLKDGKSDKSVSVLVGHNTNEGLAFAPPVRDDAGFRELETLKFPNVNQSVIDFIVNDLYPPIFNGTFGYYEQVGRTAVATTESHFTCAAYALKSAVEKSYGYVFNTPPALHVADATYMFYDPSTKSSINTTVAYILQDYLINFILHGAPDNRPDGFSSVPTYGKNANVVPINANNVTMAKDPAGNARCKWWEQVLYN